MLHRERVSIFCKNIVKRTRHISGLYPSQHSSNHSRGTITDILLITVFADFINFCSHKLKKVDQCYTTVLVIVSSIASLGSIQGIIYTKTEG
ncbi:hypothetical protein KIN20_033848 [Parelaphostrongylus tenuis]|uniref:Uncharacterized protein n=1 Tax=Parelaphostrongylus tenuis TaxID=148309 RepID=A0AAD5R8Z0_PARTN|nr:hypothetical protein KIN20_033848 [Parelaphostrongylus tenuis]